MLLQGGLGHGISGWAELQIQWALDLFCVFLQAMISPKVLPLYTKSLHSFSLWHYYFLTIHCLAIKPMTYFRCFSNNPFEGMIFCIDYNSLITIPSKFWNCHGLTQWKYIPCSHNSNVGSQWYPGWENQGEGYFVPHGHSNILTSIGLPAPTGSFHEHLGIDHQILDGRVLWEGLLTSAHIPQPWSKSYGHTYWGLESIVSLCAQEEGAKVNILYRHG